MSEMGGQSLAPFSPKADGLPMVALPVRLQGRRGNVVSARVIMDVSARVIKLGYAND